jgi:serpin B
MLQILSLPYEGGDLSMVVVLPKAKDGLAELERGLSTANLEAWTSSLSRREVDVYLPKFTMTSEFQLNEVLHKMGMIDAFTEAADFSGMNGRKDLFISAVLHKAFVDVNEEGTEAAAATAVVMEFMSVGPQPTPVFRADHPFLFMIRHNKTGAVLFMGRVVNPQAQE